MRFPNLKRLFMVVGLVALLLLGASTGLFPGNAQEDPFVPLDVAFRHAAVAMVETVVTGVPSLTGGEGVLEEWQAAMIGEPLTLFDINAEPLFYSFPVMKEGSLVGRIWVSASKLVGSSVPVKKIGSPPWWNVEEASARLEELAAEQYPDWNIRAFHPVVYAYPKIGAMAIVQNPRTGEEARLVIDMADWTVIPDAMEVELEEDIDGLAPWFSFLDSIPPEEWSRRMERWSDDHLHVDNTYMELMRNGVDVDGLGGGPLPDDQWRMAWDVTRALTTCNVLITDGGLPAPGGVTACGFCQATNVYCCAATGRMIAALHGVDHSQSHIASVMSIGPKGAYLSGQFNYYTDCANGLCMTGSFIGSPDWNTVLNEIAGGRPVHTRIGFYNSLGKRTGGHCRPAFGVRTCETTTGTRRDLGIVDPWPPKQGCGVDEWEDWDTLNTTTGSPRYENFIYVRPVF